QGVPGAGADRRARSRPPPIPLRRPRPRRHRPLLRPGHLRRHRLVANGPLSSWVASRPALGGRGQAAECFSRDGRATPCSLAALAARGTSAPSSSALASPLRGERASTPAKSTPPPVRSGRLRRKATTPDASILEAPIGAGGLG